MGHPRAPWTTGRPWWPAESSAAGKKKWRTLDIAETARAGRFTSERLRASAGGQWRAVFAGDKRNVPAKSAKAGARPS